MTKLSARYTFFYKKVFPTFWFGFLGFLAFDSIKDGTIANDPMFIVVPCLMAVFGFFFMRKFIWDLADEVFDGGDFLLVKYRGAEDKILLANIMNVSASASTKPYVYQQTYSLVE